MNSVVLIAALAIGAVLFSTTAMKNGGGGGGSDVVLDPNLDTDGDGVIEANELVTVAKPAQLNNDLDLDGDGTVEDHELDENFFARHRVSLLCASTSLIILFAVLYMHWKAAKEEVEKQAQLVKQAEEKAVADAKAAADKAAAEKAVDEKAIQQAQAAQISAMSASAMSAMKTNSTAALMGMQFADGYRAEELVRTGTGSTVLPYRAVIADQSNAALMGMQFAKGYDDSDAMVRTASGSIDARASMTDEELKRVFAAFDSNDDGRLDIAELLHFIKALKKKDSKLDLEKIMAQWDENKDGQVEFNEFKTRMSKYLEKFPEGKDILTSAALEKLTNGTMAR